MTVEFLGEWQNSNGKSCNCSGATGGRLVKKKLVYGVMYQTGDIYNVDVLLGARLIATGLFKEV